jgi:hypothetical protein
MISGACLAVEDSAISSRAFLAAREELARLAVKDARELLAGRTLKPRWRYHFRTHTAEVAIVSRFKPRVLVRLAEERAHRLG